METLLQLVGLVVLVAVLTGSLVVGLALWSVRRLARAVRRRLPRSARLARPVGSVGSVGALGRLVLLRAPGSPLRLTALLPGAQREPAGLRLSLRRDVAGTVNAVSAAARAGRPVQPLTSLARRVRVQAQELDVDLAVLGAEPDPVLRRCLLAEHSGRVAEVRSACAQLREGLLAAGAASRQPDLSEELAHEVQGLWLRARAYRELVDH